MTERERYNEILEMGHDMVANAYNNMVDGTGSKDENLKLLHTGMGMISKAREYLDKIDDDVKDDYKRRKEGEEALWKAEKAYEEYLKLHNENLSSKSEKNWDKGLKIAGMAIAIGTPIVTGIVSGILLDKKLGGAMNMMKLNTVLQEKGAISGLNNAKILNDNFSEIMRK